MLTQVPPVTVILAGTGLAVWAEGLYFLGVGAEPAPIGVRETGRGGAPATAGGPGTALAGPNPIRAVGWIMFIAGLSDLVQTLYVMTAKPLGTPETTVLAGMLTIPSAWFCFLGIAQIRGLDMRVVGNVAIPVALVPLFWWNFFSDSRMIQADLIIWGIAFLSVTFHSYGYLPNRVLGGWLVLVAAFAFFLQPVLWALGYPLP